ncbi:MAG: glycerol kinase GlpK [Rhizobiales bacterium]|nr:glycerol kinase GlpK [Hyphomicrobiales bacterium]NRB15923.1 glycerol kinase GlpK [Hyphomicrobiales bacterium]
MKYILAIDQGTTSSRAILFDQNLTIYAAAQQEFTQHFPASGWVEHDPTDIWQSTLDTCHQAIKLKSTNVADIAAIGITNQRETTLIWDKTTGQPIYNAIVWQDRRTADICDALKQQGHEPLISKTTGLLLDPYFSATKIKWLLDNVEGARQKAINGQLLFGTVDCFLIWKLTGGKQHVTDATNAARTMLYNIGTNCWDAEICQIFDIPLALLPEVKDCAADFGHTEKHIFGHKIPICGVAGDQQAATIGQACFKPGMLKSTYGTGCFALLNTGKDMVFSQNRLLTTIAYQLNGQTTYALEGSIFNAGTVVQWLRDGLQIIDTAEQSQVLAQQANAAEQLYFVPAFTGLGAPYWDANCRGAIYGLTRNSGRAEFAAAALQSVAFQTRDLLEAMQADWGDQMIKATLRVDGGMAASDWTMQFLADILDTQIDRPTILETTALGVAWLAGSWVGLYPELDQFASIWRLDKSFSATMDSAARDGLYAGWQDAVNRTLSN